jgi:cytochrome b6-f complex iron-sulfur subunit
MDADISADELLRKSRRSFLRGTLAAWTALGALPALVAILQYLTPRPSNHADRVAIVAAEVGDIPQGGMRVFRFNKEPVILVHTRTGQFKAFSARCTHMGCVVQYVDAGEAPRFECHCHGSQFDITGKNIAGPAPRPLPQYKVTLNGSSLLVVKG